MLAIACRNIYTDPFAAVLPRTFRRKYCVPHGTLALQIRIYPVAGDMPPNGCIGGALAGKNRTGGFNTERVDS